MMRRFHGIPNPFICSLDLNPFDEGGLFGKDEDGDSLSPAGAAIGFATGGIGGALLGGAVGNELEGFGQTNFQAQMPANLQDGSYVANQFANPSAAGVPGTTLRDTLMGQLDAAGRPVPQGGGVTAGPVAPAGQSTFNTGLLAPGMGVAGAGVGVTGVGLGQADQTRGAQVGNAAGRLTAAADGLVPSAAEVQMGQGLGRALRGNLALAASARGTNASKVAAQRGAQDANAATSASVLGQTAALRAQEQAVARGQLTGALEGIRTGDLGTAQTGLGLLSGGTGLAGVGAQVGAAQLGSDTQTQLANLQARTGLALGQLQADQATELANLDAQLKSRGLDDAQRIATLGAILQIDARTLEGQMALQQLLTEASLKTQAINAQIATANAGVPVQLAGAGLGALGDLGGAALGAA